MNKKDIIIALLIFMVAGMIYITMGFLKKEGDTVQVYLEGTLIESYSLKGEKDVLLEGYQGGMNHLVIHDGKASIVEADCKDHLCVKQAAIYRNGESIICLPHRLVIQIKEDDVNKEPGIDAMTN